MPRTALRFLPALVVALTLAVGIAACGSAPDRGGGGSTSGGKRFSTDVVAQRVAIGADPSGLLKWDRDAYTAVAGDVTFVVANPSSLEHNFVIRGNGLDVESRNFKGNTTQNFTLYGLVAGEYQIICTFPGHEATMTSKLTVR